MPRNALKKKQPAEPEPQEEAEQPEPQQAQIIEREITLSLINDKVNYITGLLHKIAEACEINEEAPSL